MTSGEFDNGSGDYLDQAFRPEGVVYEIARAAHVGELERELTPGEVADIIQQNYERDTTPPRWQLVANVKDAIRLATESKIDEVFDMASKLGMRHETSISDQDLSRINPHNAVLTVEPGANRTAAVRRAVALDLVTVVKQVFGVNIAAQGIFQFASDRQIGMLKGDQPNPEFVIAQEIGGIYLPDSDVVTEFEVSLASALLDGWQIAGEEASSDIAQRIAILHKYGYPELILLQPYKTEQGGLDDGFSAVSSWLGSLEGRQLVIATNGQYRPKDEAQADRWARAHGFNMLPPVAVGDEPGYTAIHNCQEIVTAERLPWTYVIEAVILERMREQAGNS